MAAKRSIEDALNSITPELTAILSKDFREELDKRITILDLSYEALKVNVYRNTKAHRDAYDYAYNTLVEVLNTKATRQYRDISEIPKGYFDRKSAPFLYINASDSKRFLIAKSFEAIRNFVTDSISRDPRLIKTAFGQNTIYTDILNKNGVPSGDVKKTTRTKVDIGHIASDNNPNLVSPLELKISAILDLGNRLGSKTMVDEARQALSDLYSIQANATYSFKNTAPEDINNTRRVVGEGYVVVTLHRQKLNSEFSRKELEIFNTLRANLALKLSKIDFTDKSGSNTIQEDLLEAFAKKFNKNININKHKEKVVKPKTISIKANPTVSNKTVSIKKKESNQIKQIQDIFSLSSLQALMNAHLQDVVAANMGMGNDKKVLNYRTGRLAASAKVERLTQSKEGMITAFYTYMKNPYATFSEGGRQQYPRSRDPKLLISKSIKEIAATKAITRMRAVLV